MFECQQCGTCCKNLLEEINGIINGLFLTYNERKLFSSDSVYPKISVGRNKPEKVIAYQLDLDICPYLDMQNSCKIYHERPLTCQAFPLEITMRKSTTSVKCPVIGSKMKINELREVDVSAVEFQAAKKLQSYIINRARRFGKKSSKIWNFNLKNKMWVEVVR